MEGISLSITRRLRRSNFDYLCTLKQQIMGMDRNTVIGFILIGVLLIGIFYINSKSSQAHLREENEKKRISDSIAASKRDLGKERLDSLKADSIRLAQKQLPASFIIDSGKAEQLVTLENDVLKITFTNKGGQPQKVELKKFKRHDGKPLILEEGAFNSFSYAINAGNNQPLQTVDIPFVAGTPVKNADQSEQVTFTLRDSLGKEVVHQYILRPGDYMVDFNISMRGSEQLVANNRINLQWQAEARKQEHDYTYEKDQSEIAYVEDGDFDFSKVSSGDDIQFKKPVEWVAVKQQFFISALSAKTKMENMLVKWVVPADTLNVITRATTTATVTLNGGAIPLQFYYGPSDYDILKKSGNQMQNIVPYGTGIFAFVKYINRHILLPVFNFLKNNIASMGIVILLLTLFIRLLTSPILYKSYLSGAKMKALKPEVDRLKEKYGEDKQAFSMEQMKLWKSAGVSPLGGCLPALLQIPIFMSLYYFFQSNVSLRGQNFLWANDLAAYDSIAQLPFYIPLYGDHVSLFTLTAVVTSLLISIYSMSNMQDNSNPVMKYMPYIFPILLLGVFNRLPAALTWYYTVSNTITLILQIIIQKYIINHEKILAQIEENRKRPVKQSKFQERMQAMQESQKKLQEMKKKNNK